MERSAALRRRSQRSAPEALLWFSALSPLPIAFLFAFLSLAFPFPYFALFLPLSSVSAFSFFPSMALMGFARQPPPPILPFTSFPSPFTTAL